MDFRHIVICALLLCGAAGTAQAQEQGAANEASPPQPRLDLKVAKINDLFTQDQIRATMRLDEPLDEPIEEPAAPAPDSQLDTVIVEGGAKSGDVSSETQVPSGLAAVLWGFAHPLQLWRIFLPAPAEEFQTPEGADK